MTPAVSVTIVNVGYRSTNFWVVSARRSRLLVDLGWPGMFGALQAELRRKDIPLGEITHGFATHYHMDHAGAAQDLKNQGMRLIVTQEQVAAVPAMKQWERTMPGYTEIDTCDNLVIASTDSRELLATLRIAGELIHTPGIPTTASRSCSTVAQYSPEISPAPDGSGRKIPMW